jgi:hypothetical protein
MALASAGKNLTGVTWQTELVRVEQLVDDDAPDPRPNRRTRRAMQRAARRTK